MKINTYENLLSSLVLAREDLAELEKAGAQAFDSEEEFEEFLAFQKSVVYSLEESVAYIAPS